MVAITFDAIVNEDHSLTIHLPPDMPTGRVEIIVRSLDIPMVQPLLTRETARLRLLAAGSLSTFWSAPEGFVSLTDAELWELGQHLPLARPAEELIDEDRGTY